MTKETSSVLVKELLNELSNNLSKEEPTSQKKIEFQPLLKISSLKNILTRPLEKLDEEDKEENQSPQLRKKNIVALLLPLKMITVQHLLILNRQLNPLQFPRMNRNLNQSLKKLFLKKRNLKMKP